jgi:hypothetical protein
MPLVILHHLLNVSVQLANKWGFKQKKSHKKSYYCGGNSYASTETLSLPMHPQ